MRHKTGQVAALLRRALPALVLAAGASAAHAQCTGFQITSSTGAAIVPGTTDSGNHNDDGQTSLTLPFGVSMYGTTYNTAQVCSNGNLQFTLAGSYPAAYSNECLSGPPTQVTGVAMFPYWDDLMTNVGTGSGIYTSVSGTAPNRVLNVEWRAVYFANQGSTLNFEVRLFEDNSHFEFIYGAVPDAGASATVGVQNASGLYNQFECNTGGLSSGLKLTFTPLNSATVLCASGAASPSGINNCSGATTLLTVAVTPGTNPPSTGITVSGNLSSIGGSATQQFYDDGTHGDAVAGDNTYSFLANVPASVSPGAKQIAYSCADQQSRAGAGSIAVTVNCVAPPNPTIGPDVVTWDITDVPRWGTDAAGTTTAYSVGTTSSNEGDYPVNWINNTNYSPDYGQTQHPVISQNMYRLKPYTSNGTSYMRFEQLGQSWLKHGFVSTNSPGGGGPNTCSTGTQGALGANLWRYSQLQWQAVGGEVLSVGCTDTYGGSLNGSQGNLGPKNVVNVTTGYSDDVQGTASGDATTKGRLQVPTTDVTAQPAGTRFFVDAWYVTQDDCQFVAPGNTVATNGLNSASWRELVASQIGSSSVGFVNNTQRHFPGIYAWTAADPTVSLVNVDDDTMVNPGTGYRHADGTPIAGNTIRARFLVGVKTTSLGGGLYRYEYAVYNHNHDRSGQSFSVPVPASATVSEITYHAPLWHSGEPYSNTPWTNARVGNAIVFSSTQTYAQNVNANALRWGELFNFGFTTNVAPVSTGHATIALFKPGVTGQPNSLDVAGIPVPNTPACGTADFNCDGAVGTDADIESFFSCLSGSCPPPPCTSTADFNGDGVAGTDADIEAFFRVLSGVPC
jgi:hypothetical protein